MNKYLLILVLISTNHAFAAANKWIDEQGKIHYSDQSPPTHARVKATINTGAPEIAASAVPDTSNPAAVKDAAKPSAADKKAAAEKAAQEAAVKEQKQANCLGAKQNLANLKDGMRIATTDPTTGERSFLDDDQRQKKTNEAQQQINKYCQ